MISCVLKSGQPNAQKRNCFDCKFCKGAVSWWCTNKGAVKDRGTSIPGVNNCPHWEPVKTIGELSFFERLFGGFIYIDAK